MTSPDESLAQQVPLTSFESAVTPLMNVVSSYCEGLFVVQQLQHCRRRWTELCGEARRVEKAMEEAQPSVRWQGHDMVSSIPLQNR